MFDPIRKAARAALSAGVMAQLDPGLANHDVTLGLEAISVSETNLVNTAAKTTAPASATGSAQISALPDTFQLTADEQDIRPPLPTLRPVVPVRP